MLSATMSMCATKSFTYHKLLLAVFLLAVSFGFSQHALAEDWTIKNFDSVIEVNTDSTLTVTETIDVDFFVQKHGIMRNIPVVYHDDFYNKVRAEIQILSVSQDGQPATYQVNRIGSDKIIRIGDPNITITGEHYYEIRYRVERALLYYDDFDELYWNATGSTEVPIEEATAVVFLPGGAEVIQAKCFTGVYGSIEENCGMAESGSSIAFAAAEQLTVAVGFSKGFVDEPTAIDRLIWFLKDNKPAIFPLFLIIGVFVLWWKMGRDPKLRKTIIPEYEPPEGLWAPYLGLLLNSSVSRQAISAMIIHLAVAGYLTIRVDDPEKRVHKKITLIKQKDGSPLDLAHQKLMQIIFSGKSEATLDSIKNKIQTSDLSELRHKLYQKMKKDKLFTDSSFWLRTVVIIFAVVQLYASVMLAVYFGAFTAILLFVGGIVSVVFGLLMPKRTLKGAELARQAAGFKLFMQTAERYRSQWQEEEHIFFDYLPYAIIFKDTDHWAKVFSGMNIVKPDWYQSAAAFNSTILFTSEINSFTRSFSIATTPTAPSSGGSGFSSSSGGGFSGGGFGGGGTSSW